MGPLVGDQEATQIFIIYMHDIVLEISFLDLNNGPNLSPSNLKLWKEVLITQKGVIRYQIFLHVVDGHEKTDFLCGQLFWLRPFFDLFSSMMDQKNDPSQKSC